MTMPETKGGGGVDADAKYRFATVVKFMVMVFSDRGRGELSSQDEKYE